LGSGLGLSTVYGIVRQSGGFICVYSEPGRGSTFKVYLPSTASPAPGSFEATMPLAASSGHETVLLVEDEEALRTLAARVLGGIGYRVLSAGDAAEALELLAEGNVPDVLLTDVVLPGGMQGNDLARTLLAEHPDLPVLYMSGYGRNAIDHAGRLDEGVNYLEKPFTPEALTAMLRRVIDAAPSGGRPQLGP
jgi:CheY-like chemotaxis protein